MTRSNVRPHPNHPPNSLILIVWDNVYGFDYTPMKEVALAEPIVDVVEAKAVVTNNCPVFTIDLYTVQTADLSFSVKFELYAQRSDFIHALIAWFDIEFGACHKPIRFSTSPHARYTHWKQTVFYLHDVLTVEENECVTGWLTTKPNEKNRRDLDINISYQFLPEEESRISEGQADYKMYGYHFNFPRFSHVRSEGKLPHWSINLKLDDEDEQAEPDSDPLYPF
jgi:type I protein arginine methyltransferase